jgi:hypothetical protein
VSETEKEISIMQLQDLDQITESGRPLLIGDGIAAETVDSWIASVHAELSRTDLKPQNTAVSPVSDLRTILT